MEGYKHKVERLLREGKADVNFQDKYSLAHLHHATMRNNTEMKSKLIPKK
jgi:ankyrin repeat protein